MPLVFAPLLIPLFALLAALVLMGLSQTHSATQGTSFWQSFTSTVLRLSGASAALNAIVKASRSVVSHFAGAQLKHIASYFNAMAHLWKMQFAAMRANAEASAAVAQSLEHAIPREAEKAAAPALAQAKLAHKIGVQARAAANADAKALTKYKAATNPQIKALHHAVADTIPYDIGQLRDRAKTQDKTISGLDDVVQGIEHGAADTWDWIRTHPLASATTAFASAVAIALGRIGLGNLNCNNFKNMLRNQGCGLGTLLERLLPLAVLLVASFDFPEFVSAAELVAEGIGDAIQGIEGAFPHTLDPLPPPQG